MDNVAKLPGSNMDAAHSVPELLADRCQQAIHGGMKERGELARMLLSPTMQTWAKATDEGCRHPALTPRKR
jgi:hypothetical protein